MHFGQVRCSTEIIGKAHFQLSCDIDNQLLKDLHKDKATKVFKQSSKPKYHVMCPYKDSSIWSQRVKMDQIIFFLNAKKMSMCLFVI